MATTTQSNLRLERASGISGFDAVVVGSGYGGSIAACRLAQAGLSVCLLEKGKRWEPHEFPTTVLQLLCNTRLRTPLASFGKKNSMYEVNIHGDSLSVTASGLGGGSLVNAGVIIPTPQRARNDPRWPREWERDWNVYEAKGHAILEPEDAPYDFPMTQVMDKLVDDVEEASRVPIKLMMSFNRKKNVAGVVQDGCIACGNCLTGCPYNAKSSTDKNYLQLAAQAGAEIYTEKEVLFISQTAQVAQCSSCNQYLDTEGGSRRWRVHLNAMDYVSADYVVLAAGVLGSTEILLRSQERGLALSEKLGHGLSCNGNNIALVTGTSAQTQAYAYAFGKKDFSNTTIGLRPGPAISSSLTSSLGFTIQAATIPEATPHLVLKGIVTFRWPMGFGFLYGLLDHFKQWIGTQNSQALVLNTMGYDASDGQIEIDEQNGRVRYRSPKDSLFSHKIRTVQKLAQRLGGDLYLSRFRSTAVQLLGGCNAAPDSSLGVTNPNGQVFTRNVGKPEIDQGNAAEYEFTKMCKLNTSASRNVHAGLYVCDGSVIPCSVGVNPIGTITTISERIASCIVKDATEYLQSRRLVLMKGGGMKGGGPKHMEAPTSNLNHTRGSSINSSCQLIIHETLNGELGGLPCTMKLIMHMGHHRNPQETRKFGDQHSLLKGYVGGKVLIPLLEPDPLYVVDGYVDMCSVDERTPFTQFMHYHLLLSASSGSRFILNGKKEMRGFLYALRSYQESTTLHVKLEQLPSDTSHKSSPIRAEEPIRLQGTLHVSAFNLLKSLLTLQGPRRVEFLGRLLESLLRTYFTKSPRTNVAPLVAMPETKDETYPDHVLHEIITGDGVKITCKQWCMEPADENNRCINKRLVLLLNGYVTESFCLPTERQDLVRTLLRNGYEPWLLQPRLHPSQPVRHPFNFDDIAKFDIPAAFAKMEEVKKEQIAAHVIAHCIGGLSIHMALMGGYIPVSSVTSLICTNSSMFFSLVPTAMVKLALPLIPISMRIMGTQQIIPICVNPDEKISLRHKLLRAIARAIPRTEWCICDECNVLSGIFGNGFWHANVRRELHDWLVKQAVPVLPMAAFPHLRTICLSRHIVDAQGKDTYMIHSERLALPTTYISGGRPILVKAESSKRAHDFMKRHHPEFDHARIVIPDYGHSDLWIGENSHRDVFPHVLQRLQHSEEENMKQHKKKNAPLPWELEPASGFTQLLLLILFSICALLLSLFILN